MAQPKREKQPAAPAIPKPPEKTDTPAPSVRLNVPDRRQPDPPAAYTGKPLRTGPRPRIEVELAKLGFQADALDREGRHLDVGRAHGRIARLAESEALRGVVSLGLQRQSLTDRDIEALVELPNLDSLRWLSVEFNRITPRGVAMLASSRLSPQLVYLNLAGNDFDPRIQVTEDQGMVVDEWLAPESRQFIDQLGLDRDPAWLYVRTPPDRLSIEPLPAVRTLRGGVSAL
jgi:hypothetical protein